MPKFFTFDKYACVAIGAAVGAVVIGTIFVYKIRAGKKIRNVENMMELLQKSSVKIKDRERVESIIQKFIIDGKDKLQVIADFDRTLSAFKRDGKVLDTCHNALDMSSRLPEFYKKEAIKVRDIYYPIEIDPKLTVQEKYPYMVEWWTKAHNLLLQCNMTRQLLTTIIEESNIFLRDGCDWAFQHLHKAGVPVLIFSAGIGDVIEEVVTQQTILYDNMRIVSNYMDFNAQGQLVGFQGDLIHTFNKNESAIHKSDYFEKLQSRENVILLGDSMGDLRMADGCAENSTVLKIGFLNDKIENLLPTYLDLYDIVLVSDETMDVPNAILKKLL